MPISINTNTVALEAMRNLDLTAMSFTKAVQRLSSGLRINSAADDPSGLGVSQKLIAQINGFDQAQRNTQDALSLLQTAQAGLTETMTDLQRLNQLALEAANGTLTSSDRLNIQLEVQGLLQDIDRVAQQTKYNGQALLNGALGATVKGGGPNITDLRVQGVVTAADTYTITAATSATQSTITGNTTAGASSTMTGGGSITITGPTGLSETFTSYAGETVSDFILQVNNANIGVTLSVSGGSYVITSNNFGVNGAGANGVTNSSGPQRVTATGSDVDFGFSGANLRLVPNGGGTTTGTNPNNARVTLQNSGGTMAVVDLSGLNTDQFNGTGIAAVISFRVVNPGSITANIDSFSVTQNAAAQFAIDSNGSTVGLVIDSQSTQALGINTLDMTTQSGAQSAITTVQTAITQLSAVQSNLGALQNVLSNVGDLNSAQELNAQKANSNLVDADIPQETVSFTRAQILLQAGTAVLAQANQLPLGILGLFSSNGPVL